MAGIQSKSTYRILLKRSRNGFNNESVKNHVLQFGEPLYINPNGYFVIGGVGTDDKQVVADCKMIKALPRTNKLVYIDTSGELKDTEFNVIDSGVYYRPRQTDYIEHQFTDGPRASITNKDAQLMDNESNNIYPYTTTTNVIDINGKTVTQLLIDKITRDKNTSVKFPTVGYDDNGPYISEEEIDESELSDSLKAMIHSKVSTDEETIPQVKPISLGVNFLGPYLDLNNVDTEETNFIKAYIDSLIGSAAISSLTARVNALQAEVALLYTKIEDAGGLVVSATAPASTNKMWLDTNSTTGGLKYYSQSQSAWVHVPVAYS